MHSVLLVFTGCKMKHLLLIITPRIIVVLIIKYVLTDVQLGRCRQDTMVKISRIVLCNCLNAHFFPKKNFPIAFHCVCECCTIYSH